MRCKSLQVALLSLLPFAASAQSDAPEWIGREKVMGLVRHAHLEISDQVIDGCWTSPTNASAKVRLLLEQNGVAVQDFRPAFYDVFNPVVLLTANGYRTASNCVASARFAVFYFADSGYGGHSGSQEYRVNGLVVIDEASSVFTNGGSLDQQLGEFFEAAASEFLADVISARRDHRISDFFSIYPQFVEEPMSGEEFEGMLKDLGNQ